jgi:dihydroxyacid dehydratase/phosphogluconate dehydratase
MTIAQASAAGHAYSKDGGLAVLYGNFAENGCIVKTAAWMTVSSYRPGKSLQPGRGG